jgi:hypothetical protein
VTLTAQQPLNNVVRVTVQALAAALGGTQSLHTNGYDEALALPTEESATLALRTQQVLAHESGVGETVDPLAGSYYVERSPTPWRRRRASYLDEDRGDGRLGARHRVHAGGDPPRRVRFQKDVESGEQVVVGVNRFTDDRPRQEIEQPDFGGLERGQVERLRKIKSDPRRQRGAGAAGGDPRGRPRQREPDAALIDAVKARVSLGEISDALRAEWGYSRSGDTTAAARTEPRDTAAGLRPSGHDRLRGQPCGPRALCRGQTASSAAPQGRGDAWRDAAPNLRHRPGGYPAVLRFFVAATSVARNDGLTFARGRLETAGPPPRSSCGPAVLPIRDLRDMA